MLDLLRPNHAYLLGFLLGDGTLYAGRGRKGRLSVEVSARDGALLERLGALLPGASLSTRERPTNFSPLSSTVVLSWCRYDVREAVRAAGMPVGRKDRVVAPPDAPFSTRDLARGFVDADGSVGFTARSVPFVSVVSNSLAMARWWTAVVQERSGVTRTATPNRRDGAINVMVQSDAAARLCAWLHQSGDLALERKRSTALQVAGWTRPPGMRARSTPQRWTRQQDARVLAEVPVEQLADELGRTVASVAMRRWRLAQQRQSAWEGDGVPTQAYGDPPSR